MGLLPLLPQAIWRGFQFSGRNNFRHTGKDGLRFERLTLEALLKTGKKIKAFANGNDG